MVRDLEEQLKLKTSENISLNKQIDSLHQQLSDANISKNSDAMKETRTSVDKIVCMYIQYRSIITSFLHMWQHTIFPCKMLKFPMENIISTR